MPFIYRLHRFIINDKNIRPFLVSVPALTVMHGYGLSKTIDPQLLTPAFEPVIHQAVASPQIPTAVQLNPHLIYCLINRTFICLPYIYIEWQNPIHSLSGIEIRDNVHVATLN